MTWWWYPIADGDPAEERQFSHKTFLHQVTDILDACVPLYNWSTGASLANIGPYTEGVTDVSAIWKPIQVRIETLVSAFYDYSSISNADWMYPAIYKTPWGMADNVFELFKDLARDVPGIPTAHKMRKEDVDATGISWTIAYDPSLDGYAYTFPADIAGFKWNSITVDDFDKSYGFANPEEGYFTVTSKSENSEDTTVWFANLDSGTSVTINYKTDAAGFGWTRRIDDPDDPPADPPFVYADGQAADGDVIHACLINQIYACTVVLQGFAVLVNHTNSNVAGTPGGTYGGGDIAYTGAEQCEGDDVEACNDAKGDQEADWPGVWTGATNVGTDARAEITGSVGGDCFVWAGSRSKYSYTVTNFPTETFYEVKDFVRVDETFAAGGGFEAWFIAGGTASSQVWDLDTYSNEIDASFVGTLHGGGNTNNPVSEDGPVCNDPPMDPIDSWGYSAEGWMSLALTIPDPTSSAP